MRWTQANRARRARAASLLTRRWARLAVALLSGAALSLTLPPLSIWPGLFAYAGLLAVLMAADEGRPRPLERLWLGAAFGLAFHLCGLWWVGMAFLVDTASHGALLPLGVVGLPLLLAPFHAVAAWLTGFAPRQVVPRALALVAAIALTEALRGVLFTGFPWNVPASQMAASLAMAQGVGVVGLEAMAVPAVLIGVAPAFVFARRGWARLAAGAGAGLMALGLFVYGTVTLNAPNIVPDDAPLVRVVQPNIRQVDKWNPAERTRIWSTLLTLTDTPTEARPALVVWPETAFPFLYRTRSVEQSELSFALPAGAMLLAGAVETEGVGEGRFATNSVYVIDGDGVPVARYDKARLVPFGEYLPLGGLLDAIGLKRLVSGGGEFRAGPGPQVLATPVGAVQPLVCYEVIFPRFAPEGGESVRFLANLTNDAWFGDTPGPHQHLRLAQLRAIGSGIPVVRAANTGVSAVIDPRGRMVELLPLGEAGVIDAVVPAPEPSMASRGGWAAGALLWLMVAVLGWGWAWRLREKSRGD